MSGRYNALLKDYPNRGLCGDEETVEDAEGVAQKAKAVADLLQEANHVVVFTGAGISTSCGIADFRGPSGVWTREMEGREPPSSVPFAEATPSPTHDILAQMVQDGLVHYIVSQNVDGLHLRSGVPRNCLAELHGNVFMEKCEDCGKEHVREEEMDSVGFQKTGRLCEDCNGALRDTTLDWDSELPKDDLDSAIWHTKRADVCICLGTSLRIRPAGNLPLRCVRRNGKPAPGRLVIVNLQKTHLDRNATIRAHARCDEFMAIVAEELGMDVRTRKKKRV